LLDRKRVLAFVHAKKNLGALVVLDGASEDPVTVKMQALGTVEGMVRDAGGKPWAGLKVRLTPEPPVEDFDNLPDELTIIQGRSNILPTLWSGFLTRDATTDKDGRFRLEGALPGVDFTLYVSDGDLEKPLTLVAMKNKSAARRAKRTTSASSGKEKACARDEASRIETVRGWRDRPAEDLV
jgi:hypothetical protein